MPSACMVLYPTASKRCVVSAKKTPKSLDKQSVRAPVLSKADRWNSSAMIRGILVTEANLIKSKSTGLNSCLLVVAVVLDL